MVVPLPSKQEARVRFPLSAIDFQSLRPISIIEKIMRLIPFSYI